MNREFKTYRRKGTTELRPYVSGEDVSRVSISEPDRSAGSPKEGDWIARNPDNHDDQWLVARAYFDKHMEPVVEGARDNLTFGGAIEAMKAGKFVRRRGWNGKGMYLWMMPGMRVRAEWCKEPHLRKLAEENGGEIEALGSIRMKTADGKVLTGWLASQTDMLLEDWEIVTEP